MTIATPSTTTMPPVAGSAEAASLTARVQNILILLYNIPIFTVSPAHTHRLAFPSDTHYPLTPFTAAAIGPGRGSPERNKRNAAAADARVFCNDVTCVARWPIAFCRCIL